MTMVVVVAAQPFLLLWCASSIAAISSSSCKLHHEPCSNVSSLLRRRGNQEAECCEGLTCRKAAAIDSEDGSQYYCVAEVDPLTPTTTTDDLETDVSGEQDDDEEWLALYRALDQLYEETVAAAAENDYSQPHPYEMYLESSDEDEATNKMTWQEYQHDMDGDTAPGPQASLSLLESNLFQLIDHQPYPEEEEEQVLSAPPSDVEDEEEQEDWDDEVVPPEAYLVFENTDFDTTNWNHSTHRSLTTSLQEGDVLSNTVKINCGSDNAYDAASAGSYRADMGFYGLDAQKVHATADDVDVSAVDYYPMSLYQTCRYGSSFSYAIPAKSKQNFVRLHFADILPLPEDALRLFRVTLEGATILDNIDIRAAAGGVKKAWIWQGLVHVSDGSLDVDFTGGTQHAFVNAIEVHPLDKWMLNFGSIHLVDKLLERQYVHRQNNRRYETFRELTHVDNLGGYPPLLYQTGIGPTGNAQKGDGSDLFFTLPVEGAHLALVRFHMMKTTAKVQHNFLSINGRNEKPWWGPGLPNEAVRLDFGRVVDSNGQVQVEFNNRIGALEVIPVVNYLLDVGCIHWKHNCLRKAGDFWPEEWTQGVFASGETRVGRNPYATIHGHGLYPSAIYGTFRYGRLIQYTFPIDSHEVTIKLHFCTLFWGHKPMNIYVQDELVSENFDPYVLVGHQLWTAYVWKELFYIQGGRVTIRLESAGDDDAALHAIEVYPTFVKESREECEEFEDVMQPCGTQAPVECQRLLTNLLYQYSPQSGYLNGRSRQLAASGSWNKIYEIPVVFHAIYGSKNNKVIGQLDRHHRIAMMQHLRDAFQGDDPNNPKTPFRFVFKELARCTSATCLSWHHFSPGTVNTMKSSLRRGGRFVLNIYLGDITKLNYLGVATFPEKLVLKSNRAVDGIMLMHPGLLTQHDAIKANRDLQDMLNEIYVTLPHEAGHWLGLYHTFEGTSCNSHPNSGDGIKDTAAQKCPSWDLNGYRKCFKDKDIDTCPKAKGKDSKNNIMDYIHHDCAAEFGQFTENQIDKMITMTEIFRLKNYEYVPTRRHRELVRRQLGADAQGDLLSEDAAVQTCLYSLAIGCDCDKSCFGDVYDLMMSSEFNEAFEGVSHGVANACNQCNEEYEYGGICRSDEICVPRFEQDAAHRHQFGRWCAKPFDLGRPVTNKRVCNSGYTHKRLDTYYCIHGDGESCVDDNSCYGNYECKIPVGETEGICFGGRENGDVCQNQAQCQSHNCVVNQAANEHQCQSCTFPSSKDEGCSYNRFCHQESGVCRMKKGINATCGSNDECFTGMCHEERCVQCYEAGHCELNRRCLGGTCGDCTQHDQCGEDHFCDLKRASKSFQTCLPQKLVGIGASCEHDFECQGFEATGCSPTLRECAVKCKVNTDCASMGDVHARQRCEESGGDCSEEQNYDNNCVDGFCTRL